MAGLITISFGIVISALTFLVAGGCIIIKLTEK